MRNRDVLFTESGAGKKLFFAQPAVAFSNRRKKVPFRHSSLKKVTQTTAHPCKGFNFSGSPY